MISQGNIHYKELLKMFTATNYAYGTWELFSDFLIVSATAISNSVDEQNKEQREKQYLETIGKYPVDKQEMFPEMLAHLVLALEYEKETGRLTDILGHLFHELNLHNKYKGQYFTPQNICDMMGVMSIVDSEQFIKENGYIMIAEPTCGSGCMVLGFANAMRANNLDFTKQMVATATDIDLKCVHMCYIQLVLYAIPAVVIHGNSLTDEEWSHWYTPMFVVGGWGKRVGRKSAKE